MTFIYKEEFINIKDSISLEALCSDRSPHMMNVYSMFFYKDDDHLKEKDDDKDEENSIVIHFEKEDEEGKRWYLIHWKSNSNIATNIQSQYDLMQAQAKIKLKKKTIGTELYKQLSLKDVRNDKNGIEYVNLRDNYPTISVVFREDHILWTSEWNEHYCLSSNGRYLGMVSNWEDGDDREAPELHVLDLKPLLQKALVSIRLPFRIFVNLLKIRGFELRFEGVEISKCNDRWIYLLLHVMVDNRLIRDNIISFL